jgi:hypothetical protein
VIEDRQQLPRREAPPTYPGASSPVRSQHHTSVAHSELDLGVAGVRGRQAAPTLARLHTLLTCQFASTQSARVQGEHMIKSKACGALSGAKPRASRFPARRVPAARTRHLSGRLGSLTRSRGT